MKQKSGLLLLIFTILTFVLAACSFENDNSSDDKQSEEGSSEEENVLRIAETADIPTMDPIMTEDNVSTLWIDTVYEGLYRQAPGGEIVSGIAKKEETEVSDDGLTYTFHLREDAKWANGDPVTAQDFVYGWQRAVNPDNGSFYGNYLMSGKIKNAEQIFAGELPPEDLGVSAPDDYTFVVELEVPVPYFDSYVINSNFLPAHKEFVEEQGDQFSLSPEGILANGPFKMTSWQADSGWELEKNEEYWDAENVALDGISVKVIKQADTRLSNYEVGELDRVTLQGSQVSENRTSPEYQVLSETAVFYMKMNQESLEKSEYMQNKNFRMALAKGFDKQAYIDVAYGNDSTPIDFYVPTEFIQHPETEEDFQAGSDLLSFDVEAAQEYWAAAKEELGFEEVSLSFLSGDTDTAKSISEVMKTELEKNLEGLTIETKNVPWAQQLDLMREKNYELAVSGWGPDYLDAVSFLDVFVTGGENNDVGYSNEEYDSLVKSAKTDLALDPVARFEALQDAEKILLEDAAIAPIMQRKTSVLVKDYVEGLDVRNPFANNYSFKYVELNK
ncbi:peptide ABC transporter substrate-binding protein [Gracilibacillus dipsosauri]|uniref:Peptide ABC transporter substrate-binding protein n=1 Tax=Gracilibacillus dipsosauri TaxID=178340 RepID=A0A317KWN6_9BACI|nr:peptide ABC transporter substrate-binding protein [Gracilibacillus dipsosauri]PWU67726.1 peptide ABC transporter substrate-binding protein [Gracilibacillus dipsosauri]